MLKNTIPEVVNRKNDPYHLRTLHWLDAVRYNALILPQLHVGDVHHTLDEN